MMSNGQPSGPMYGRRPHDMPYNPQLLYQHPYHGYPPQHIQQHYPPQPPPQWGYYGGMPPMQRPFPPYMPMMNAPYPMPQPPNPQSMSPRPAHLQHAPPPNQMRPHQSFPSPSVQNRQMHQPPPPPPNQPATPTAHPIPPPDSTVLSHRMPFYPELPWLSVPEQDFPPKSRRWRRMFSKHDSDASVLLPSRDEDRDADGAQEIEIEEPTSERTSVQTAKTADETPTASIPASDNDSTHPSTPSSAAPINPSAASATRQPGRAHAIIPVVPNISSLGKTKKSGQSAATSTGKSPEDGALSEADTASASAEQTNIGQPEADSTATEDSQKTTAAAVKPAPKSWADLVRNRASSAAAPAVSQATSTASPSTFAFGMNESLANILSSFEVSQPDEDNKISFIKPRGLINTGNMCYMNSVLQMLIFCVPFYGFLDHVGKQAAHSFNSDTPMLDAMIMFIREFSIIDSAASAEQLMMRLKDTELEEYGEAFIPEFVYEVIRRLPRFSSMRRGHQQDAEEFLGFLLEQLHEECVRTLKGSTQQSGEASVPGELHSNEDEGWLEVGPKQRAAITRASGLTDVESPITKIFGGKLRSELRVPGAKNSVTLEPYQPLQLDIGSPQVNNIMDALRNLTKPERLHGAFNSPRGPGMHATKQVSIETLPPVLILHLKRFQYDNAGGTQKIWKKIGYPLELEIPKEVFPPHRRGGLSIHGALPKYRLIGVVYHHGKIASGGHYTVDVRRQNDREWLRFDDTVLRRVRSEEVAEGGSEEDPRVLAAALEQHKRDQSSSSNIYDQVREDQEEQDQAEKGWSQVSGTQASAASTSKKWSAVANGHVTTPPTSSGKRTPVGRYSTKDNKVAYLLFYQRVG